jgi:hypothetical protein
MKLVMYFMKEHNQIPFLLIGSLQSILCAKHPAENFVDLLFYLMLNALTNHALLRSISH